MAAGKDTRRNQQLDIRGIGGDGTFTLVKWDVWMIWEEDVVMGPQLELMMAGG
jgi:hypothetical protein